MNPYFFTLPNGLRCVYLFRPGAVTHCGLVIGCGSRDEEAAENGVAHLIEHMLFKGTTHRSMFHILNSLDRVGGELNAFTSKEETWIHASVESSHWKEALDVISDIARNSTFPAEEIRREKEVIIDEMNSYKDQPGEMIFEEFDKLLFGNHALGKSILGTEESLKSIDKKALISFFQRHYTPWNSVISIVGQQMPEQIEKWVEHCFGPWKGTLANAHKRKKPASIKPKSVKHTTDNHQAHYVSGCRAVDVHHKDRRIVALMTNYLGGPALNSRLSYELREKNGIAYHIEANYNPYHDCGMFSIYAGTSEDSLVKMEKLIRKELDKIREGRITSSNLKAMKKQIGGQLTLASESASSEMFHMARSILLYGKVESHSEIIQSIEDITLSDFHRVSSDLLEPMRFSTLIYI